MRITLLHLRTLEFRRDRVHRWHFQRAGSARGEREREKERWREGWRKEESQFFIPQSRVVVVSPTLRLFKPSSFMGGPCLTLRRTKYGFLTKNRSFCGLLGLSWLMSHSLRLDPAPAAQLLLKASSRTCSWHAVGYRFGSCLEQDLLQRRVRTKESILL